MWIQFDRKLFVWIFSSKCWSLHQDAHKFMVQYLCQSSCHFDIHMYSFSNYCTIDDSNCCSNITQIFPNSYKLCQSSLVTLDTLTHFWPRLNNYTHSHTRWHHNIHSDIPWCKWLSAIAIKVRTTLKLSIWYHHGPLSLLEATYLWGPYLKS